MTDLLIPPLGPADHVVGPPGAPLELVMYGDFQCPFCTAAQPILRRVRDRLDGRLRFAFRHFPLRDEASGRRARRAGERGGGRAGRVLADARRAVRARGQLGLDDVLRLAARIGLDAARIAGRAGRRHARAARRRPTSRAAAPAA